jgi:hypothetical protein
MVKRPGALPPGRLVLVCPLAYLLIAHQRVYPIIWLCRCLIGYFLRLTEAGDQAVLCPVSRGSPVLEAIGFRLAPGGWFGREAGLTALRFLTPRLGTRFRKQFHRRQAAFILPPCLAK